MRINSDASIRTAEATYEKYGSWAAVKAASVFKGGVFVLQQDDVEPGPRNGSANGNGHKKAG